MKKKLKTSLKNLCLSLAVFGIAQTSLNAQIPAITNQPVSRALWAGGNVMLTVGVTTNGSFTYQWQLNNTNLLNGIITTVAGNGSGSYSGDGGAAINAGIPQPNFVGMDAAGDFFITEEQGNFIRKVDTNGVITIVAGNTGAAAYAGDGGSATNASLSYPTSVAVDASGNLFIADSLNQRIRKVDTNGIITTVVGNGGGYSGDGGVATNASMNRPLSVAVDTFGNLFIADYYNNHIRKVNTNGIITTVAGNGQASYSGDGGAATNASLSLPNSVAVDVSGNLFISDHSNLRIRKVSTNGVITTVAGNGQGGYSGDGGAATNATFNALNCVVVDAFGNLFIADYFNNSIRKVNTNGIISTVAGNSSGFYGHTGDGGAATNATLSGPVSVALDTAGNLFIADDFNKCIRKVINTQGLSLTLNNVSMADAGRYQVVVTGSGGAVTSSVVNLVVTTSPLIYQIIPNSGASVALNFVSRPLSINIVFSATNLLPPIVWQPLSTNLAGADGNWQFTDTNAANHQTIFYRSFTP